MRVIYVEGPAAARRPNFVDRKRGLKENVYFLFFKRWLGVVVWDWNWFGFDRRWVRG